MKDEEKSVGLLTAELIESGAEIVVAFIKAYNHPFQVCPCQHCCWYRKADLLIKKRKREKEKHGTIN